MRQQDLSSSRPTFRMQWSKQLPKASVPNAGTVTTTTPSTSPHSTTLRTKLKKTFLTKLVKIANTQRELAREQEFENEISTRMLIDCADSIRRGLDPQTAIQFSIIGCFDHEGGEESDQNRVLQVFQKENLVK